jgi:DNA-binding transcriptional ArsR family regulator
MVLTGSNHWMILEGKEGSPLKIDFVSLKKASLTLRALNHALRQKMITLIDHYEKITVTEIFMKLRLEQSVASQHLAILRRAGIVKTERDGKYIYYRVAYRRLAQIIEFAEDLIR